MSSQIFFDELSKNKKVSEIFLTFLSWLVILDSHSTVYWDRRSDGKACMDTAPQTPNNWQVSQVLPSETKEVKF